MHTVIAYLTSLLRRFEHAAVGDVSSALSPLTKMLDEVKAIRARAIAKADALHSEANALRDAADEHTIKAVEASNAVAKLTALVG